MLVGPDRRPFSPERPHVRSETEALRKVEKRELSAGYMPGQARSVPNESEYLTSATFWKSSETGDVKFYHHLRFLRNINVSFGRHIRSLLLAVL